MIARSDRCDSIIFQFFCELARDRGVSVPKLRAAPCGHRTRKYGAGVSDGQQGHHAEILFGFHLVRRLDGSFGVTQIARRDECRKKLMFADQALHNREFLVGDTDPRSDLLDDRRRPGVMVAAHPFADIV